jgi:hypothetical protein
MQRAALEKEIRKEREPIERADVDNGLRVLSRGRGRALAYRSAPHQLGSHTSDAAGQRLARNPLPRATRSRARGRRVLALSGHTERDVRSLKC